MIATVRQVCVGLVVLGLGWSGCTSPDQKASLPSSEVTLQFDPEPASPTFGRILLTPLIGDLDGLDQVDRDSLSQSFAVWQGEVELGPGGCVAQGGQPSLLGDHRGIEDGLEFVPRFPLRFGTAYTACADLVALGRTLPGAFDHAPKGVLETTVLLPERETRRDAPRVVDVWPPFPEVPANLLRIYLHFDQPMTRRDVASKIALLDQDGVAVRDAFVEIPNGLWDSESKRLTLFLHPGRIKRGVGPNQRLGPVLREGQTFVLRVDDSLTSSAGVPLASPFERGYRIVAADRTAPAIERWRMEMPSSADQPLVIHFEESLDREQLRSLASVWRSGPDDPQGGLLAGGVEVPANGRSWKFSPAPSWQQGSYELLIRPDIEDLAGNRPGRLFDFETQGLPGADQSEPLAQSGGEEAELRRRFEIRFPGRGQR